MAKILFVTETYIKANSPISNNVDIKLISDSVGYAQDAYVQDVLGTNLYIDLQTKFEDDTLTPIEEQLVELIEPMLTYRAVEQALPFMQSQVRNKGVVHQNSDFSQQADLTYMKYLREELKSRAQFLTERIINFLCTNKAQFPLYTAPNTDISATGKNGYEDFDLYLDSSNGCSCKSNSCGCN